MALSGHANRADECPLLGVKRTSLIRSLMTQSRHFDRKLTGVSYSLALPTQEVPYTNGERHAEGDRHIMQGGGDNEDRAFCLLADDLLAASFEGKCAVCL